MNETHTPLDYLQTDKCPETLPSSKHKYEIMKHPAFPTSLAYPQQITTQPSFSTQRTYHIIPKISTSRFTFTVQSTSLYMHLTDYTFKVKG